MDIIIIMGFREPRSNFTHKLFMTPIICRKKNKHKFSVLSANFTRQPGVHTVSKISETVRGKLRQPRLMRVKSSTVQKTVIQDYPDYMIRFFSV